MKKRVLSVVLACMLAFSAAACGKDGSKQGGQTGQDAAGGQDAAQGTESGTDEPEDSSAQAVWVEMEKEEPALDWSAVEEAPEEDFRFSGIKLSGCVGVEINEYLGEGGVVKIPTSLGGQPVISIDDYVFSESGVTDVYFEAEGFVYIKSYAFAGCTTLNSVVIKGNEDTELRTHAFADCTNLTSVVLSGEITEFREAVFWGTPWLENKKQEAPLVIVNNMLLDATLYEGDLVIPDGVIRVVGYAAWENENITSLTVPDSVQRIEAGSFGKCVNLTRVSLPDGIRTIGGPYGFAGDPDIVITHRGIEYTYEQLEELDSMIWSEYLNSLH
ncbi:MAG: leucine-rich repeat domain-containing protein [Lachnospiraceae bacterium]|nr:leucine-rich repeat domain-containing protein [Lachnospiraceae bacterium]